jgi:hypothetical protein
VKSFKYLGKILTNDGRYTCEIKCRIAMAKAAFNKKTVPFISTLDLELRKKLVKCYIWSIALYGAETWTLRAVDTATLCVSRTVAQQYVRHYINLCGPGSSICTATGYGLDGPKIESRCGGEIFHTSPDRPWGPPSFLYNGYRVFPGVKSGRDVTLTPHPLLGPLVMKV